MRYLLDTHVLLWAMGSPGRLSQTARDLFVDRSNDLIWSTASTWELAIKWSLHKIELPEPVGTYLGARLVRHRIEVLPVGQEHALRVAELPAHHRDPFDRLLVAQAQIEGVPLLTSDPLIQRYAIDVAW